MQVNGSVGSFQEVQERTSRVGDRAHRVLAAERQIPERVPEDSREGKGFDIKRSRLREVRQFRKQENRALYSAKRQLKQITHAVRDELKEIGRAVDGRDVELAADDGYDPRGDGLNQTLRHLNRDFRHDVKQAFRDAREGRNLDGERLIADTRAAFERLVNDVKDTIGAVSVKPPDDDGEATGVGPVTTKPFEPAEPADTVGVVEVSALEADSPNVSAEGDSYLSEFVDRIEQLLTKLTDLLSPAESEESATTSFTVEFAVTAYARATFSFEGQASGSGFDAVS